MQEPPDPQAQAANLAAIARVRRLMVATMGVTFIALAVVLGIIGYRVFTAGGSAPANAELAAVLPAGAKVISTAIGDGRLAVTIDVNGATEIRLFDLATLKPLGRLRVSP